MLSGLDLPLLALLMTAGLALDRVLGEPRCWHPLAGFGRCAGFVERRLNRGRLRILRGAGGWMLLVLPPTLAAAWLATSPWAAAMHALLLYFAVGLRSLRDHVLPIGQALAARDLEAARSLTARIVSRDTAGAGETDLAKAAVESTLENGNDAVFGALFWFAVAGGPGALLFRLANTLDAMWGYRSSRFLQFGRVAARADDLLNWIPARLTALSYLLLGDPRCGWRCWRTQAAAWPSPNAGPVMSAGAGALGLALGGSAVYDGIPERRPPLGEGRAAGTEDIDRAWRLVARTAWCWLAAAALAGIAASVFRGGWHA
ncbi:MAG TPA: CobD/CbiB family cobalamin biosynthesis protein [Noviherbaspirillum sp.]|jgi:adenosylcobinamide-phosphate synthase|uniref:CobD/CbiB family cobalamin biosynthesis protein n=1 Tax=Noviherbaspirillum sp. TaxID=1926288 RepID=UPI002F9432E5